MEQVTFDGLSVFVGALFGGLFGFIFEQFGAHLERNRRRWAQHHNALVRLDSYCNVIFSLRPDNQMQFELLKKVCEASSGGPMVMWSQPTAVPLDPDLMEDLLCISTKNLLFSLRVKIRKFNQAIDTSNRATQGLLDALNSGKIDETVYRKNLGSFGLAIDSIIRYLDLVDENSFEIAARARLMLRHEGKLKFWQFRRLPTPHKPTSEAIREEILKMRDEMDLIVSSSRAALHGAGIDPT